MALLIAAAPALAGPTVSVRVEGLADTLVPRTPVAAAAAVAKDGTHSCAADTAAAALEQATTGDWSGAWNPSFSDYGVDAIKGESHPLSPYTGVYWAIYVDGIPASAGICGTSLQQGDELLLAAVHDSDAGGVLSVAGLPATVAPGTATTVTVTRKLTTYDPQTYAPTTTTTPAAGATVAYGGASATADAGGHAALTFAARGPATVRATLAGDIRSAAESTCVTDGADGACGTSIPATPAPAATPDTTPAFGRIAAIGEGQHFAHGSGPRELSGTVDADPSGIAEVRLRLTRRVGTRCEQFDGTAARWVRASRCGTESASFFSIGNARNWSYLLPAKLTRGRYVLDTQTVDGAGNVTRGAQRGTPSQVRNRVVFWVQ